MKKLKKVASKKADDSIKTVTESVIIEIPKSLEDYIQGVQDKAVQFGYDNEAAKLTRELIGAQKPESSLKNSVATRIMELADDLVRSATLVNYRSIGIAYQIGILLIVMKERLRSIENGRPSTAKYKKWLDALIDAYVRGRLGIASDGNIQADPAVRKRYDKLFASKQRQLQKYVNLAQCGEAILKYGYGGIDGALEIRWMILDIEEIAHPGITPKITPEMARVRLAGIEARFPFPTPDELAGKQAVKEMRSHVDALCTYFRLVNSGVSEEVVTFPMAQEYAVATGMSLDKSRAELAPDAIKDEPDNQKAIALGEWLRGEANRANNLKDDGVVEMTPGMVMDYLAKIERWKREVKFESDTYRKLGTEAAVRVHIDAAYEVVTALHIAVHTSQTGRVD